MQDKKTGKNYIVEQKNFYGYKKGKLTVIVETTEFISAYKSWSIEKQKRTIAWKAFVNFNISDNLVVKVKKNEYTTHGKILIWSSCKDTATKDWFCKEEQIDDIITVEEMIKDLISWDDENYKKALLQKKTWVELFVNECMEG